MFATQDCQRGAFLEAAREARKEREAERLRDEAAVIIQSAIRGWLCRNSNAKEIRFVMLLLFD